MNVSFPLPVMQPNSNSLGNDVVYLHILNRPWLSSLSICQEARARPESAWWQKVIVESLVYIKVRHMTAREILV